MAKIAVDIVLLPSEEMADKILTANKELLKRNAAKIVLDKESCMPHISFAMGCIDEKDIHDIGKILKTIAQQNPLGQLSAIGIHTGTNRAGEKVSVFQIEKTESLQSLHEEVMQRLVRYFSYDVRAEMVLSSSETSESTLDWIKNYPEDSSFDNFFPHITIGYGEINNFSFPIKFNALKLALCHLGNHCTCRKILASVNLKNI
jgi:2'-5' RNA ligase